MLRKLIGRRLRSAQRESVLSPHEVADLIAKNPNLANVYSANRILQNEAAVRFRKTKFSDEYVFFRSGKKPAGLLVCFTGKHRGCFISVPTFLQLIGPDNFDVLVFHDKWRARHLFGIEGFSSSLHETAKIIVEHATSEGYRHVTTFGCSMGGYSAISAGLLAGADRAISLGGMFLDHKRWFETGKKFATAFDPICNCFDASKTEIVAYYSENHARDTNYANLLKAVIPAARPIRCRSRKHNMLLDLQAAQTKRLFLRTIFDLSNRPSSLDYDQCL